MLRVLVGLFTILFLCGETVPSQALETVFPLRRHIVEIRDFGFHPKRTIASPGDKIVWINRDIVPHTATATDRSWDSNELGEGESWKMTVENSGMQQYFCDFHPHMKGVLEVHDGLSRDFTRRDQE